jgi:ATP-dependent DNA helicase RecG
VTHYRGQIEFHHPDLQDDSGDDAAEQDKLIPVYPESEGLTNRQFRKLIEASLEEIKRLYPGGMPAGGQDGAKNRYGAKSPSGNSPRMGKSALSSTLPLSLRKKQGTAPGAFDPSGPEVEVLEKFPSWLLKDYELPNRLEALEKVHLPPKESGPEFSELKSPYHRRIIFEEFFWLELYLAAKKSGLKKERAFSFQPKIATVEKLRGSLPFQLTGAQNRAFSEILTDLEKPHPMHRLVQGDVGSGKTLVALMASLVAQENGFQSAIMVPTEILAEQHYQNARRYLEPLGVTVGLLTGSMRTSERNQTFEMLRSGLIQLVVGTHALIQDEVEFKNLGLVVIDEQHRFGVQQRSLLKKKGMSPHFLVMTATPIPRTLAMTVYGDLDVSVIDELPAGRSPIVTRVTYESKRPQVLQFLKEQLEKGRQAYVVYPLVEESEKIDLKDAMSQFEILKAELPQYKIGLLHGKMKPDEKDEVMREFRAGNFHVLVSTTVIEVGVDVPNANLMIVEHAERFGLSQLHQLRGRVGRGAHKSFCVLVLGKAVSDESRTRTEIMEKTTDGFKIAEADLEIRGPGEFLGTRQSGLPGFKMANLVRDVKILQDSRKAAFEVLSRDSQLIEPEHRWLRQELLKTHGATALASVG